jgi:hypothetical protein
VIPGLIGVVALLLSDAGPCLLRDPAIHPPPTTPLGAPRDGRAMDLCPPERVRASELPLRGAELPMVPRSGDGPFECEHDGCWAWAGVGHRGALIGAAATLEVWSPSAQGGEHSLAELALRGGPGLGDVLEIGWAVSPRHREDGRPFLLVRRWAAGRLEEGSGRLHPSSSAFAPGMDLSPWIGRTVRVGWLRWEGRWWAWFEGSWIGWYGGEEGTPFDVASTAQWFGEVFFGGRLPTIAMGNGRNAKDRDAARFRDLCTVSQGKSLCTAPPSLWPQATDSALYGVVLEGPDGFRYGGAGAVSATLRPRPPPSSASGGTPPATGR